MQKTVSLNIDLQKHSENFTKADGDSINIIKDAAISKLSQKHTCSVAHLYEQALQNDICPYRYIRNQNTLSLLDQLRLAQSKVAVIGAGGLGGQSIILLARMGVGFLKVVDYDRFDETNLNRQALSSGPALGEYKAAEAQKVISGINPAVTVEPVIEKMSADNIGSILEGVDIVIDALDNITDRFVLEHGAQQAKIPLIYGAIAGFDGQISFINPGDNQLKNLFGDPENQSDQPGSEKVLGVPAVTAAITASLQTIACIKYLLNHESTANGQLIHLSLDPLELNRFYF